VEKGGREKERERGPRVQRAKKGRSERVPSIPSVIGGLAAVRDRRAVSLAGNVHL
jgi:hypothetical protein